MSREWLNPVRFHLGITRKTPEPGRLDGLSALHTCMRAEAVRRSASSRCLSFPLDPELFERIAGPYAKPGDREALADQEGEAEQPRLFGHSQRQAEQQRPVGLAYQVTAADGRQRPPLEPGTAVLEEAEQDRGVVPIGRRILGRLMLDDG